MAASTPRTLVPFEVWITKKKVCFLPGCWNISMVCGEVCTGSERVLCTELWLRLGMLLLPPGLANQRFCGGKTTGRREV